MTSPRLDCGHELRLVADPAGPFWGPLAHGYATGALMDIHGGLAWNALLDPVGQRAQALEFMAIWEIEDDEQWATVLTELVNAEYSTDPIVEVLLGVRTEVTGQTGTWDRASWLTALSTKLTEDGSTTEVPASIAAQADAIVRYEDRMRVDGILAAGEVVRSTAAYDFGRAASQASWGFGAGYCTREDAERVIVSAGEQARAFYAGWADFGTGYVLGRALAYDEGEFGHLYTSSVGPFQILISDPQSPWLNLPFR